MTLIKMSRPPSTRSQGELIKELDYLRSQVMSLLAEKSLQINRIAAMCERITGLIDDLPNRDSIVGEWKEIRRELLCLFAIRLLEFNIKPGGLNIKFELIQQYSSKGGDSRGFATQPSSSSAPQNDPQQAQKDLELKILRSELDEIQRLAHQIQQQLAQDQEQESQQPSISAPPQEPSASENRDESRDHSAERRAVDLAYSLANSPRYYYAGRTIAPLPTQIDLPHAPLSVAYQARTCESFRKSINRLGPIPETGPSAETLRSLSDLLNRGHLEVTTYRRECPTLEHNLLNIALLALTPWLKARMGEANAAHIYSLNALTKIVYQEFVQATKQ